jgi:hypothetical protein
MHSHQIFSVRAAIDRLQDAAVRQWTAAERADSQAGTFLAAGTGFWAVEKVQGAAI